MAETSHHASIKRRHLGGVFLYLYKTKITYLSKALLRHFSRGSGGVFLYLYKTKITYLSKALLRHFSRGSGGVFYTCKKFNIN
ncbi:hypothetical protein GD578_10490 [Acinetobacter nosocomialis]|uniref:Uncharacterized protein n=1 Tax=Acinetobacter nosocomialis TaxID=106654 RepID=A0AB37CV93_ACINO|nr:hypothetical protein GD578_10490 [Acinetobacter nosocomialis]HAI53979.1 hypothetical protein [Acinetobacter nosocomialis]